MVLSLLLCCTQQGLNFSSPQLATFPSNVLSVIPCSNFSLMFPQYLLAFSSYLRIITNDIILFPKDPPSIFNIICSNFHIIFSANTVLVISTLNTCLTPVHLSEYNTSKHQMAKKAIRFFTLFVTIVCAFLCDCPFIPFSRSPSFSL